QEVVKAAAPLWLVQLVGSAGAVTPSKFSASPYTAGARRSSSPSRAGRNLDPSAARPPVLRMGLVTGRGNSLRIPERRIMRALLGRGRSAHPRRDGRGPSVFRVLQDLGGVSVFPRRPTFRR